MSEPSTPAPPPSFLQRLAGRLGAGLIRLLCKTLRFEVDDQAGLLRRDPHDPVIWIFWHNRLLVVPYMWQGIIGSRPGGAGMTSTSKDGEWIAQLLQNFGIQPIRGSPSRRGLGALKEILAVLKRGEDVGITPDGSRGPKYRLKAGVVIAAQLARRDIIPMGVEYSSYWATRSWDGFRIPKPFSRVKFTYGPMLQIERTTDDAAFEAERVRLEAALMAVTLTP